MAEFAADLHRLSKFLYRVSLRVPGSETVDCARRMKFPQKPGKLHMFQVIVGAQNIFAAAFDKTRVIGFRLRQGRFNEVFQLGKTRKIELLGEPNNGAG